MAVAAGVAVAAGAAQASPVAEAPVEAPRPPASGVAGEGQGARLERATAPSPTAPSGEMSTPRPPAAAVLAAVHGEHDQPLVGSDAAAPMAALGASLAPASAQYHPDLTQALTAIEQARGLEVFSALRRLWQLWDRAAPDQVEEGLRHAAEDLTLPSAAAQNYARLLFSFARLRRGDEPSARKMVAELGYVSSWKLVGPFDNTGKEGLPELSGPELEVRDSLQAGQTYPAMGGRQATVRLLDDAAPFGWIDVGAALRPATRACAFLATEVETAQTTPPTLTLWVGVRGAMRVYFNGEKVLEDPAYRGHDFDRRMASVRPRAGKNSLLVKVCDAGEGSLLSVRVADGSGRPLRQPAASARSLGALAPTAKVEGPLDGFERRWAASPGSAVLAQQYAEYLWRTDGDDPVLHQARDLARAAVAAAPTLERLLLAADLSPDRNERGQLLRQARAIADSRLQPAPSLARLLIAEAEHVESGFDPRGALPLYERALSVDPTSVEALLGKVRAYSAAGLPRSALAQSEAALRLNPLAVSLLNATSTGAGELGYGETARHLRERYAALRYDDASALVNVLDEVLARRDWVSAEHYTLRLLELHPQSGWVQGVVADAYRRMGDPTRARGVLQRALALAPEDATLLRTLADLEGGQGRVDEQRLLLGRVAALEPENTALRDYLQSLAPAPVRADERYAWEPEQFLKERFAPAAGFHRRTLLDLTVNQVYDNGRSGQFHQVVFQPLTEAGAALARQYAFGFQADRQRAELRGARVYRSAGGIDEAIVSGEGPANSPDLTMYTSARTFYVRFPRLTAGDVVELRYRIDDTGERGEFADYYGDLHPMNTDEPTLNAEYYVLTPKERPLFVDVQRLPGLARHDWLEDDRRVYRFTARALPALQAEPAMPPWPELQGFVHVSTFPSYGEIGKWYWGLSRDQLELDSATRALAHRLAEGAKSTREKVAAVHGWVVKNTRYVALEFGIYGYKPRPCVQTVARGFGDCKDKATVIVALLRELGIPATIAIVRTNHGGRFQSSVASLAPFDHAIAYVPELDLYLDGTAEFSGSGELPVMDQGALALLVNEGNSVLVTLPENDPTTHVHERKVDLVLEPGGAAAVSLALVVRGPSAAGQRARYSAESTRAQRLLEDIRREYPSFEPEGGAQAFQLNDLNDFEQPVSVRVSGRVEHALRQEGAQLSLRVMPSVGLRERYATLSSRALPLYIPGFASIDEQVTVHLPNSMRVSGLPPEVSARSEFGQLSVRVTAVGKEVTVHSRLSLSVSRVAPERYPEFRRFCEDVDRAFEERLVLQQGGR